MSRLMSAVLILGILSPNLQGMSAGAISPISDCEEGEQASGALYLICMPAIGDWNGELVVYAHGYVAFNEPIELPDLELPGGINLPAIVNGLGYAFATTSYSTNGLAVLEAIDDIRDLEDIFAESHGEADHVFLVGASEGGITTTLAVEQFPEQFDGGLAMCGPIGDFRRQINYMGDFRIVFDYFFPDQIPGSPVEIPDEVINNWDAVYAPKIAEEISARPAKRLQLLSVSGATIDVGDPESIEETVLGVLWYNVFGTNDADLKLEGRPFGNILRRYSGSLNDLRLNRTVDRFIAEQNPLESIDEHYQTSGELASPLITLHTTHDPIIPYWHAPLYRAKVMKDGPGSIAQYGHVSVDRYGHCNFKISELLVGFALVVLKATGQELTDVRQVLPDEESWDEYVALAREYGVTD